jgi:hypothetical protein
MGESTYLAAPNLRVTAADGAEYAYRDVGPRDARAIAMIQHLRGNLDKLGSGAYRCAGPASPRRRGRLSGRRRKRRSAGGRGRAAGARHPRLRERTRDRFVRSRGLRECLHENPRTGAPSVEQRLNTAAVGPLHRQAQLAARPEDVKGSHMFGCTSLAASGVRSSSRAIGTPRSSLTATV